MESAFCTSETRLIETFGWDGHSFPRLGRHMARLTASARALGFPLDPVALRAALPSGPGRAPLRLRLTLDRQGEIELTIAPLPPNPPEWRLIVADQRLHSDAPHLRHKTTERTLYDQTRAALPAGIDEAIFLNERGEVAEGTITNLFFDLGEGLRTPPLASGCLPGCLRAELLETGTAQEAILRAEDLPRARLWMGNSLRGLIPSRLQ